MKEEDAAAGLERLSEAKFRAKPEFDWYGATLFAAVVGVFTFLTVGVWVSMK